MICIAKEWFLIKKKFTTSSVHHKDIQHCGMPNTINRIKRTTTKFSIAQQQNNKKILNSTNK
jgi:hypothetical protein